MASDKEKLDQAARLQQMNINARLVSLETAMKLMHHQHYTDGGPVNKVDAITLIATAQMIEDYVLGTIEEETKKILDELNKPKILHPHPSFKAV